MPTINRRVNTDTLTIEQIAGKNSGGVVYDNRATTLVFTYSDPEFVADKDVAIIFDTLDDMGVPQNYDVINGTFQIPWAVMSRVFNNKLKYQLVFIGRESESPSVYNTRADILQVSASLADISNIGDPVVEDIASSMWAKRHAVLFPPTYEPSEINPNKMVLKFRTATGDEAPIEIDLDAGFVTDAELEAAMATKADKTTTVNGHALSEDVTVTKADVGLGNVDNTSDAEKPISEATQTALATKADKATTYTKTEADTLLDTKADKSDTYTKTETDGALALKADKATTYTKTEVDTAIGAVQTDLNTQKAKIPAEATAQNKLADKAYVNQAVSTNTANFLGTYKALAESGNPKSLGFTQAQVDEMKNPMAAPAAAISTKLAEKISNPSNNDYAFVEMDFTDPETSPDESRRYKFDGTSWVYEYTLNTSSFTDPQWAAINSGLSSADKTTIDGLPDVLATKADDSAVVHKAGAETIDGAKTFTANIKVENNNTPIYIAKHTGASTITAPASDKTWGYTFNDSTDFQSGSMYEKITPSKSVSLVLQTRSKASGSNIKHALEIYNLPDGTGYADAPYRTYNANNLYDIVTIGSLQQSTDVVHRSGNETIGGVKTFTGNPDVINISPKLFITKSNLSRAYVGYTQTGGVGIDCNDGELAWYGGLRSTLLGSASSGAMIIVNNATGGQKSLTVWSRDDGTGYVETSAYDATPVGLTSVLTAGNGVTLTTAQTISGAKTFTANLNLKDLSYARDQTFTNDVWDTTPLSWSDKNNARVGFINPFYTPDGKHRLRFHIADSTGAEQNITLSSEGWVTAPYRSYSALNTYDVVTIGSLQSSTDVVHTSGNETIVGSKTFKDACYVSPTLSVGDANTNGGLEIYHSTPFIDFHHGKSPIDYTARIINSNDGDLSLIIRDDATVNTRGMVLHASGYITGYGRGYASADSTDLLIKAHVPDIISANVSNQQISLTSSRGVAVDSFTLNQMSGKNIVLPAGSTQYQNQSVTFSAQSPADFSDYPYMASLSVTGLTADMYATVTFSDAQVSSGQYAPFCQTVAGAVRLYAKSDVGTQTIPTISIGMDDSSAQQSMSNFVTLTGAQTISGIKTLNSQNFTQFNVRSARTSGNIGGMNFVRGDEVTTGQVYGHTSGSVILNIVSGPIDNAGVMAVNQRTYNSSNTSDVVTIGSLQASTDVVHTSGNERIGGNKIFDSQIQGVTLCGFHESSGSRLAGTYQLLFKIAKSDITQAGIRGQFVFVRTGRNSIGWDVVQVLFNYKEATGIGMAFPKQFTTNNSSGATYILSQDTDYVYISIINRQGLTEDSTNVFVIAQTMFFVNTFQTLVEADMAMASIPGTEVGRV